MILYTRWELVVGLVSINSSSGHFGIISVALTGMETSNTITRHNHLPSLQAAPDLADSSVYPWRGQRYICDLVC